MTLIDLKFNEGNRTRGLYHIYQYLFHFIKNSSMNGSRNSVAFLLYVVAVQFLCSCKQLYKLYNEGRK